MKYAQIIDGALNCAYSIFAVPEETFAILFPGEGQDVEFIDDVIERPGNERTGALLTPVWRHRIEKKDAMGIHGTLFYGLEFKKKFYLTKRESDFDLPPRGH